MTSSIISCELHDYIEIACLYHYQVKLTLKNQQIIEGNALDVFTDAEKREYLLIQTEQEQRSIELNKLEKREYLLIQTEQEQRSIELNKLSKMQVLTNHAKFKEVTF